MYITAINDNAQKAAYVVKTKTYFKIAKFAFLAMIARPQLFGRSKK